MIGKPLKRLDTPDKVNGKAVYGIDAMLPGMKFATIAACPVFGGKVGNVDDSAAKKIPGVRQIVVLDDLVAVVGDHMWAAKKGLDALDDRLGRGRQRDDQLGGHLAGVCAPPARRTARSPNRSATSPRRSPSGDRLEAAYELPFLAHATDGADELHGSCHGRTPARSGPARRSSSACSRTAAKAAGLPVDKVDRPQPSARRRLRPQARAGHGRRRGAHRQAGRRAGQGGLDARGRHPARRLSAGLSRHASPRRCPTARSRLEIPRHRLVGHRALAAAGVPERHRHRRRR